MSDLSDWLAPAKCSEDGSDGNFKKRGHPQKYPTPGEAGEGSSNAADGNFWGKALSIIQRKMAFLFTRAEIL